VTLTPIGTEAFEKHTDTEARRETELLPVLTPGERETLADLVREVLIGLGSGRCRGAAPGAAGAGQATEPPDCCTAPSTCSSSVR
jgi:hypothetical protein